ncbi:MAG: hypothetical protein JSS30_00395 [Verrucomicrobia bacterium]|nr:hypothetical protein [Verrucomicrobiota bacterium]
MQVYAIDEKELLFAAEAVKGKNYSCPECRGVVRLRRGEQRQPHFFHLKLNPSCRLSKKGMIHLQLQIFIKNLFELAEMEKPFPEIGRIADVADVVNKRIFEIQFSPMSLDEAKARCDDYEGLGYQVIWILHDQTYNQKQISPSERFLRTKTCYFSNMDVRGKGVIYDQFEQIRGKRRWRKADPLPVDLRGLQPLPKAKWPVVVEQRGQTWPLYCEGDLFDLILKEKFSFIKQKFNLVIRLREFYLTCLHELLARSSR